MGFVSVSYTFEIAACAVFAIVPGAHRTIPHDAAARAHRSQWVVIGCQCILKTVGCLRRQAHLS